MEELRGLNLGEDQQFMGYQISIQFQQSQMDLQEEQEAGWEVEEEVVEVVVEPWTQVRFWNKDRITFMHFAISYFNWKPCASNNLR